MYSLCDLVRQLGWSENISTVISLLWLMFGVCNNLYLVFLLRKRWTQLGSIKILILAQAFASTTSLSLQMYLPINSSHHNFSVKQWNLSSVLCTVLPALSCINISVSITTLTSIVLSQYMKVVHKHRLTVAEAENAVLASWCVGAMLGAPLFGVMATTWDPLYNVQICTANWFSHWHGQFYGAWLAVIQYIFPVVTITAGLSKVFMYPVEGKPSRCCELSFKFIDLLATVVVLVAIFFLPLRVAGVGCGDTTLVSQPNVFGILRLFELLSLCSFISVPFVLVDVIKDEVDEYKYHLLKPAYIQNEKKSARNGQESDEYKAPDNTCQKPPLSVCLDL